MSGAILLGLILMVGGALLDLLTFSQPEADEKAAVREVLLFRIFAARRDFIRTPRFVQALGTVLVIIGILALLL